MFIFLHWDLESLSILALTVAVNLRAIFEYNWDDGNPRWPLLTNGNIATSILYFPRFVSIYYYQLIELAVNLYYSIYNDNAFTVTINPRWPPLDSA